MPPTSSKLALASCLAIICSPAAAQARPTAKPIKRHNAHTQPIRVPAFPAAAPWQRVSRAKVEKQCGLSPKLLERLDATSPR